MSIPVSRQSDQLQRFPTPSVPPQANQGTGQALLPQGLSGSASGAVLDPLEAILGAFGGSVVREKGVVPGPDPRFIVRRISRRESSGVPALVLVNENGLRLISMAKRGRKVDNSGGVRGKVLQFTAAARSRMAWYMRSLAWGELAVKVGSQGEGRALPEGRAFFVTLTYRAAPADGARAKRDLAALQKRFMRRWPSMGAVWKLEFQKRGAPHFHLLLVPSGEVESWDSVRDFVVESWRAVTGSDCWPDVRTVYQVEGEEGALLRYLGKYLGKDAGLDPNAGDGSGAGRFWGKWGALPLAVTARVEVGSLKRLLARAMKTEVQRGELHVGWVQEVVRDKTTGQVQKESKKRLLNKRGVEGYLPRALRLQWRGVILDGSSAHVLLGEELEAEQRREYVQGVRASAARSGEDIRGGSEDGHGNGAGSVGVHRAEALAALDERPAGLLALRRRLEENDGSGARAAELAGRAPIRRPSYREVAIKRALANVARTEPGGLFREVAKLRVSPPCRAELKLKKLLGLTAGGSGDVVLPVLLPCEADTEKLLVQSPEGKSPPALPGDLPLVLPLVYR